MTPAKTGSHTFGQRACSSSALACAILAHLALTRTSGSSTMSCLLMPLRCLISHIRERGCLISQILVVSYLISEREARTSQMSCRKDVWCRALGLMQCSTVPGSAFGLTQRSTPLLQCIWTDAVLHTFPQCIWTHEITHLSSFSFTVWGVRVMLICSTFS